MQLGKPENEGKIVNLVPMAAGDAPVEVAPSTGVLAHLASHGDTQDPLAQRLVDAQATHAGVGA